MQLAGDIIEHGITVEPLYSKQVSANDFCLLHGGVSLQRDSIYNYCLTSTIIFIVLYTIHAEFIGGEVRNASFACYGDDVGAVSCIAILK